MAAAGDVELWLADLEQVSGALQQLDAELGLLSAADRARAGELRDEGMRAMRLAAYRALRLVIERHAGSGVRATPFLRGEHGKPLLPGGQTHFSLAHAGGFALIGISRANAIGVDIEEERSVLIPQPRRELIEAAAGALSDDPLPKEDAGARFIAAWARLEAFAKADGRGMARVLGAIGAVGVRQRDPRAAQGLPDALLGIERSDVTLRDVAVPAGCRAAVCLLGAALAGAAFLARDLPADVLGLRAMLRGNCAAY